MDEIPQISFSQMGTWNRCKFKWELSYVHGYKPKSYPANMRLGSFCHTLLEYYYKNVAEGRFVSRNEAGAFVQDYVRSSMDPKEYNDLEVIHSGVRLITRYIRDFAPEADSRFEPIVVEEKFVVPFKTPKGKDYELVIIPDLLMKHESGKVWLLDHKTMGSARFWTDTELLMDVQQSMYSLALRKIGMDIFGNIYNMLNTYQYKDYDGTPPTKLFSRELTHRTNTELHNIEIEVGKAVDDMLDTTEYRRSLQRDCSRCWFQEPCLLGLKGMDIKQALEAQFDRKTSGDEKTEAVAYHPDLP